jgi:hypothetical protein
MKEVNGSKKRRRKKKKGLRNIDVQDMFGTCTIAACCTPDAGLLARSQYPEGLATGHLDTGFSWFPYVYKQMLR